MSSPIRTPDDYELYLYTLTENFPAVRQSTITFVRLGSTLARVAGELYFENDIRIVVRERVLFHRLPITLDWYGYEVYRGDEKLFWYDSQSHPNDESLQSTHPHHKHIPPNMKHNRVPETEMSFMEPNLPALIAEIESLY